VADLVAQPKNKLSLRMKLFAQEYCARGFHGTNAALAAGYSKSGARVQAVKLLKNRHVIEMIENQKRLMAASQQITKEWVIEQSKSIYENSTKDFVKLKALDQLIMMLGFKAPEQNQHLHLIVQTDRDYIRKRLAGESEEF
jgi:hypothetical protein